MDTYNKAAPKTYNNNRGSLSVLWNMLAVYDVENVWQKIPPRTGGKAVKYRAYTDDEVRRILANCTGFWYDAVVIAFYTGLRISDITHLKLEDINFDGEFIEITPQKTSRFKRAVFIHLHKKVVDILKRAAAGKQASEYLYPIAVKQYGSGYFSQQFRDILDAAKIKANKHGKIGFHSLRSTFITNCEEAGIARNVIQGIVGHKSPHMTERYSEDRKSGEILKKMPSI